MVRVSASSSLRKRARDLHITYVLLCYFQLVDESSEELTRAQSVLVSTKVLAGAAHRACLSSSREISVSLTLQNSVASPAAPRWLCQIMRTQRSKRRLRGKRVRKYSMTGRQGLQARRSGRKRYAYSLASSPCMHIRLFSTQRNDYSWTPVVWDDGPWVDVVATHDDDWRHAHLPPTASCLLSVEEEKQQGWSP